METHNSSYTYQYHYSHEDIDSEFDMFMGSTPYRATLAEAQKHIVIASCSLAGHSPSSPTSPIHSTTSQHHTRSIQSPPAQIQTPNVLSTRRTSNANQPQPRKATGRKPQPRPLSNKIRKHWTECKYLFPSLLLLLLSSLLLLPPISPLSTHN